MRKSCLLGHKSRVIEFLGIPLRLRLLYCNVECMNMIINAFISLGLYKNRRMLLHFRDAIFNSKSTICRNSDKKNMYISILILLIT